MKKVEALKVRPNSISTEKNNFTKIVMMKLMLMFTLVWYLTRSGGVGAAPKVAAQLVGRIGRYSLGEAVHEMCTGLVHGCVHGLLTTRPD